MGLEIDEDPAYHRREYRVQLVGRVVMALLLLASGLGLLGPGLASRATVRTPGGDVVVSYDRTARSGARTRLVVEAAPSLVTGGTLEVRLSRSLLTRMHLDEITPAPQEQRGDGRAVRYVFAIDPARTALAVRFDLTPVSSGWVRGTVRVGDARRARISQFVYP